jgi:hypothetical protein
MVKVGLSVMVLYREFKQLVKSQSSMWMHKTLIKEKKIWFHYQEKNYDFAVSSTRIWLLRLQKGLSNLGWYLWSCDHSFFLVHLSICVVRVKAEWYTNHRCCLRNLSWWLRACAIGFNFEKLAFFLSSAQKIGTLSWTPKNATDECFLFNLAIATSQKILYLISTYRVALSYNISSCIITWGASGGNQIVHALVVRFCLGPHM